MTTTASSVPTDKVFCGAAQPIYWSAKDTEKTVAQIKEHNAAWKAICSKAADKKPPAKSAGTTFKDRWYEGVKVAATAFR